MVMIIDTPTLAQLLSRVGVETFLRELADRIEDDFAHWPRFEKSARLAAHSKTGVLELMPTSDDEWFSFKLVNGHPGNPAAGLLTVTAVGMLADVATGYPRLISEMTVLTALRTAATSAMAARRLANPAATTMALIGTGAQGEFQALAFKACLGIRRIRYHDTDARAMLKFARNLRGTGLELVRCASVADAVAGAEIITTATAVKGTQIVLADAQVGDGVHINAIGGDCPGKTELEPRLLARARIFVEYLPQTRIEGDIQSLGPEARATELWQVIAGREPGRTDSRQLTIFDSVGFALEDYSALRYVYDKARGLGVGSEAPLIPEPQDPKDLFGYVARLAA
ncbi:MAG TPA: ornithine cyclodeaminase [Steroidobacteraceae bacterium]|nr:ornithine cyclodeaminase [Steroidobacteraceae bacterium]